MSQQSASPPTLDPDSSATVGRWRSRHPGWGLAIVLLGALVLASSWLALPYLVKGKTLLFAAGSAVADEQRTRADGVWQFLSRNAPGPGYAEVRAVYATPEAFATFDQPLMVSELRPDRHLVFLVDETVHTTDLPEGRVTGYLLVDGARYEPVDIEGRPEPDHHRASTMRFSRFLPDGSPVLKASTSKIELYLTHRWAEYGLDWQERSMAWDVPISYPPDLRPPGVGSLVTAMNLSAGLLTAVLAPYLLQILVVYLATVAGLGAARPRRAGVPAAAMPVMTVAMAFVVAFALLGTATGALIGWLGNGAFIFSAQWSRSVSVVSGILVILLGLWVGIKAEAPLMRGIPIPNAVKSLDPGGILGSGLIAVCFSVGCLASFSGAIAAILVIHVGALGSAGTGALAMFIVSAVVAVPFLLAALLMSRTPPLIDRQAAHAPRRAFASMVVIVAFGFVLAADNFHTLIDLIYPWLGLG